jgi:hypothetical protein
MSLAELGDESGDAEICSISKDEVAGLLRISAHGWDQTFSQRMDYDLEFLGVSKFWMCREHVPISGYSDLGEVGYWECHFESPSLNVCVLLNCGAELSVNFSGFRFSAEPFGV